MGGNNSIDLVVGMKRIAIFVGLKLMEISGFVLSIIFICAIGRIAESIHKFVPKETWFNFFLYGVLIIWGFTIIVGVITLVVLLFKTNWEYANKLMDKWK